MLSETEQLQEGSSIVVSSKLKYHYRSVYTMLLRYSMCTQRRALRNDKRTDVINSWSDFEVHFKFC